MKQCKDCAFWESYDHTCDVGVWYEPETKLSGAEFGYYAEATDDSGLSAGLKTGPLFSCIKWKAK